MPPPPGRGAGLWLGMARLRQVFGHAQDRDLRQPGPSLDHWPRSVARGGRVGARVLPPVQEREAGLPQGDLECRQLGKRGREARGGQVKLCGT